MVDANSPGVLGALRAQTERGQKVDKSHSVEALNGTTLQTKAST
jgi:hypothetical protein